MKMFAKGPEFSLPSRTVLSRKRTLLWTFAEGKATSGRVDDLDRPAGSGKQYMGDSVEKAAPVRMCESAELVPQNVRNNPNSQKKSGKESDVSLSEEEDLKER